MENQSVFFLSHNLLYKNNKTIDEILQLDYSMLPKEISIKKTYNEVYTIINNNYIIINQNKNISLSHTLAYKILYIAFRLRVAFEAIVRGKEVCNLKIPYESKITNNTLTSDQQFNIYLYMFNKYSSIKVVDKKKYNSIFKRLVDITLDVLKNYE